MTKQKIETKKTLLILVSGKGGVGKTTFSNLLLGILSDKYDVSADILHFATGVKKVALFLGWDGYKTPSGRRLLQQIGQTARAYDDDVWVKKLLAALEAHDQFPLSIAIVDDWRFPNEYSYIKDNPLYEIVKVRIESPERESLKGTPEYFEISETSLPSSPEGNESSIYEITIQNKFDMDGYKKQAEDALDTIFNNHRSIL